MFWLMNIAGIILVIIGIYFLYLSSSRRKFYKNVENGNLNDYKKIIGTVICDAYYLEDSTEIIKSVTPIVEYEVDGKTYETQNSVLEVGAELPVGTKVYVWYKKDDPKNAVLGTKLGDFSFFEIFGVFLIAIGLVLVLFNI